MNTNNILNPWVIKGRMGLSSISFEAFGGENWQSTANSKNYFVDMFHKEGRTLIDNALLELKRLP